MRRVLRIGLIASLLLTAVFTFSKEVVIIPLAMIIVWAFQKFRNKWMASGILLFSILFISFFTFFYLSGDNSPPKRKDMILQQPIANAFELDVYPTSYYFLFRSSLQMIKEHPVAGVGFGNYIGTIDKHMERGLYPKELYSYEAHDNYFGPMAQYGLFYALILIWLIHSLQRLTRQIQGQEQLFVMTALIFFLLFGFVYHSYHMRLMWLFLGLVQFYALRGEGHRFSI